MDGRGPRYGLQQRAPHPLVADDRRRHGGGWRLGAYGDVQPQIFALGGGAVIAVIAFHELFPSARRRPAVAIAEALVALGLVTGLLVLTGYGASPFFFAYAIVAVAAALAHGGRVALIVGALATLGYLGVLAVDPQRGAWTPLDGLRFGLNIGSVWLLAYLAGVFAAQERRVRRRMVTLTRTDPLTGLFNRAHLLPDARAGGEPHPAQRSWLLPAHGRPRRPEGGERHLRPSPR